MKKKSNMAVNESSRRRIIMPAPALKGQAMLGVKAGELAALETGKW